MNLETHHDLLKSYENELLELRNKLKARELEKKVIYTEEKLEKLKTERDETKKYLKKCNDVLVEYNYKIEEVEKNLYSGKTTDIKQLEYLSQEKDNIK